MARRRVDLRLVPVALGAWAAGIAAIMVPHSAWLIAAGCGCLAALMLAFALLGNRASMSVLVIALAAAGVVAGQVAVVAPHRAAAAAVEWLDGQLATVTSKVEPATGGGWRFEATATLADSPAPIAVFMRDERPPGLDMGAVIRLTGKTAEPFAGQRAVTRVISAGAPEVLAPPGGILSVAANLRHDLSAMASRFPGRGAELIPGLAVGDTTIVSEELDAQMTQSSLSHLTAVSGANCAIITGVAFWLAALCGARRGVRVMFAVVVLSGFIILVTPEPSVIRAGAMAAGAMLALLLGRARAGVPILALAVAVLLIADPWLATSIGFALSVAATGALLLLAGPLAKKLEVVMPAPLALAVAVPLAAQLACAPIIILIDPHISLIGTLANLIAAPAAPIATVIGLMACLLAMVPFVGLALAAIAWVPATWIATVADVATRVPSGRMAWPDGIGGAILLAVVTAAAIVALLSNETRWRLLAATTVAATIASGLGLVAVRTMIAPQAVPDGWAIAACDVGQGDAIVIRAGDQVALIDTGVEPAPLGQCLELLQVSHIDLLVLTHFDLDHVGGTEAVVGRVGTVLHGPVPDAMAQNRLDDLRADGAQAMLVQAGTTGQLGEARWEVLWPSAGASPGNDASVVWEVSGGGVPRSLFLGDLSAEAQQGLLATGSVRGPYDVVKVAHHGSADQEPRLYEETEAAVALIGVGENDYGHPRQEILDILAATGAAVFRTDIDAAITVSALDEGLAIWRQRERTPRRTPRRLPRRMSRRARAPASLGRWCREASRCGAASRQFVIDALLPAAPRASPMALRTAWFRQCIEESTGRRWEGDVPRDAGPCSTVVHKSLRGGCQSLILLMFETAIQLRSTRPQPDAVVVRERCPRRTILAQCGGENGVRVCRLIRTQVLRAMPQLHQGCEPREFFDREISRAKTPLIAPRSCEQPVEILGLSGDRPVGASLLAGLAPPMPARLQRGPPAHAGKAGNLRLHLVGVMQREAIMQRVQQVRPRIHPPRSSLQLRASSRGVCRTCCRDTVDNLRDSLTPGDREGFIALVRPHSLHPAESMWAVTPRCDGGWGQRWRGRECTASARASGTRRLGWRNARSRHAQIGKGQRGCRRWWQRRWNGRRSPELPAVGCRNHSRGRACAKRACSPPSRRRRAPHRG